MAAEEAALSLAPGATLASLDLRYLQPVRVGPAVAQADVRDGLGRVEVHDAGNEEPPVRRGDVPHVRTVGRRLR